MGNKEEEPNNEDCGSIHVCFIHLKRLSFGGTTKQNSTLKSHYSSQSSALGWSRWVTVLPLQVPDDKGPRLPPLYQEDRRFPCSSREEVAPLPRLKVRVVR